MKLYFHTFKWLLKQIVFKENIYFVDRSHYLKLEFLYYLKLNLALGMCYLWTKNHLSRRNITTFAKGHLKHNISIVTVEVGAPDKVTWYPSCLWSIKYECMFAENSVGRSHGCLIRISGTCLRVICRLHCIPQDRKWAMQSWRQECYLE